VLTLTLTQEKRNKKGKEKRDGGLWKQQVHTRGLACYERLEKREFSQPGSLEDV